MLSEELSALRKERGLSQAQLAEKLNVSRQAVSRWETGEAVPSVDNLIYLSRLFNVSLDGLLGTGPAGEEGEGPEAKRDPIAPAEREEEMRETGRKRRFAALIFALAALLAGAVLLTWHFATRNTVYEPERYPVVEAAGEQDGGARGEVLDEEL